VWLLKNKKAMCVDFSLVSIISRIVLTITQGRHLPFVYHRERHQPP
jgi:hypothetical protein